MAEKQKRLGPSAATSEIGRTRSAKARRAAAIIHHAEVWDWFWAIAFWYRPKTLRQFALRLDEEGVPTRRGGPWTGPLVHSHLQKHRPSVDQPLKLKEFVANVSKPSPYEQADWPVEHYQRWLEAVNEIEEPNCITGVWRSLLESEPERNSLIRHSSWGEGQVHRKLRSGLYRCSFLGENGTFEVDCRPIDLHRFEYFLSREERIAATERISRRFFPKRHRPIPHTPG